eukprot:373814_1
MSELMDIFLDIKNKIKDLDACEWKYDCNILHNVLDTRKHLLLSIALAQTQKSNIDTTVYDIETYSKMEILNVMHVRLLHEGQIERRRARPTNEIMHSTLLPSKPFKDKIEDLQSGIVLKFCEKEDYDTEALYDDIFPDNDAQSNIYNLFKKHLADKIDIYILWKDSLSGHDINPPDKNISERNLGRLDFGEHVTDWKVKPKFRNMKEEWLRNEFFSIGSDIHDSMHAKSKMIAEQKKNKINYNLSIEDVLCTKMYTDTDELQAHFRCAFRSSSTVQRRCQFIHWATHFHIVFIKVEVANHIYKYNESVCTMTLYHGLNRLFDTKGLVRQFYGCLSTTLEETVAQNFAGGGGMILTIDKKINNNNLGTLDVDWISCHDNEEEVLLMNPIVLIQRCTVFAQDVELQSSFLKSTIASTIDKEPNAFGMLSVFLQSSWIYNTNKTNIIQE